MSQPRNPVPAFRVRFVYDRARMTAREVREVEEAIVEITERAQAVASERTVVGPMLMLPLKKWNDRQRNSIIQRLTFLGYTVGGNPEKGYLLSW